MDANEKFLRIISQIESSGGKDLIHKRMTEGLHKGDRAIGEYGLMPKTVDTINNRRKRDDKFGPDENIVSKLRNENEESLEQFLQHNPRIEDNYANEHANFILNRIKGDPDKAAYLWNQGEYTHLDKLTPKALKESDYVKKFKQLRKLMDKQYAK